MRSVSRHHWIRVVVVLAVCAGLFATGVGIAYATTHWSSYKEAYRSVPNFCFYVRENYRDPALNPSYDFDFNGWHYMRQYSSGCSISNPTMPFGTNLFYLVKLWLYDSDSGVVCDSTIGNLTIPGSYTSWGVGKGYIRSGACSSTTHFSVYHQVANWLPVYRYFWYDFTYIP